MAPVQTRAVLLRGHDYGDTSRILRFYTSDHGVLSVMARGVRGRSGKGTTAVSTFASGELTVYVKPQRDLHTMRDFVCTRPREGLAADVLGFAGASAAAELVLAHADTEHQPGVFDALEGALDGLTTAPASALPATVLAALWSIVDAFGFGPQLDPCVRCGEPVDEGAVARFDFAAGGMRCVRCSEGAAGPRLGPVARAQLRLLVAGHAPAGFTYSRRHLALCADFIAYHVAPRPLKSLAFLASLLPADPVEAPVE